MDPNIGSATAAIEWRCSDRPVAYEEAVAAMEQRIAAIRTATAPELVWLLEHPPLYTAGTSARAEDLLDPQRLPVYKSGRGGQYTYHGPGQRIAYVMLDLERHGRDVAAMSGGSKNDDPTLARFNVKSEQRNGRIGVWIAGPAARGQDRRDRRPRAPLGQLSRRRAQRRSGPRPVSRHRPCGSARRRHCWRGSASPPLWPKPISHCAPFRGGVRRSGLRPKSLDAFGEGGPRAMAPRCG
jgi:hypothetical protein